MSWLNCYLSIENIQEPYRQSSFFCYNEKVRALAKVRQERVCITESEISDVGDGKIERPKREVWERDADQCSVLL